MKRVCGKAVWVLIAAILVFSAISCNPNPDAAPKVYVISMGIGYGGVFGTVTVGGQSYSYDYRLTGTVEDATEFGVAYSQLLDDREIDYEIHYMLQEENPTIKRGENLYFDDTYTWDRIMGDEQKSSPNFPSVENFEKKIDSIVAKATKNDLFVFYYSGHGAGSLDATEPSTSKYGPVFLTNSETEYDGAPHCDIYTYDEIFAQLEKLPCRKALILDCCHSGNMVSEEDESNYWSNILGEHKLTDSTAILAAARYDEYSWSVSTPDVFNNQAHGLMSGYLINHAFGWTHNEWDRTELDVSASLSTGKVSIENCVTGTVGDSLWIHGTRATKYTIGENLTLAGIYNAIYSKVVAETFRTRTSSGEIIEYKQHMVLSGGPVTAALAY